MKGSEITLAVSCSLIVRIWQFILNICCLPDYLMRSPKITYLPGSGNYAARPSRIPQTAATQPTYLSSAPICHEDHDRAIERTEWNDHHQRQPVRSLQAVFLWPLSLSSTRSLETTASRCSSTCRADKWRADPLARQARTTSITSQNLFTSRYSNLVL